MSGEDEASELRKRLNEALAANVQVGERVVELMQCLAEVRAAVEANAADTLWLSDGVPMTIVERINAELDRRPAAKGGG